MRREREKRERETATERKREWEREINRVRERLMDRAVRFLE